MSRKTKFIPDGFHSVTPSLVVRKAAEAIEFYKKAFGATEAGPRLTDRGSGAIVHAELKIGDSVVVLGDEVTEWGNLGPESTGGTPVRLDLYVEDVDAVVDRVVELGGRVLIPVADQFYGDRAGRVVDPYGHIWVIATHKEDISPEEMQRRFADFMKRQGSA